MSGLPHVQLSSFSNYNYCVRYGNLYRLIYHQVHVPIDLENSLLSVPMKKEGQMQFACTWNDQQHTFMVLHQSRVDSPTLSAV